jgi:hypothetical protein
MHGNRTKHKILGYYIDEMLKAKPIIPPIKIRFTEFVKVIKGVKEDTVATHLFNMKYEGYVKFSPMPNHNENDHLITITDEGIAAHSGEHFLKKNKEFFWKVFMNTTMTVANVAVAITAVWALTRSNEIEELKERLNRLEMAKQPSMAAPNPNTPQSTHSGQTNPLDSAKTIDSNRKPQQ